MSRSQRENLPLLIGVLLLGICAVSTGSIFATFAKAPPLTASLWRCAIGAIVFSSGARGIRQVLATFDKRQKFAAFGAGILLAVHFATFIGSLKYTSVGLCTVLISTSPIWAALLSATFKVDRVTKWGVVGTFLACAGSATVALGSPPNGTSNQLLGVLLAVLSGMTLAGYFLLGRIVRPKVKVNQLVFMTCGVSALALLGACALTGQPTFDVPGESAIWLIALGLVPQVIGHTSFNWSLAHLPAHAVTTATLGEPICATLLAWMLLGQVPGLWLLVGGLSVIGGATIVILNSSRTATGSSS